jgi:hypothetical protein
VSRTIRRPLFGRTPYHRVKDYGHVFHTADLIRLRHPPRLKDQNSGHWEVERGKWIYTSQPSQWGSWYSRDRWVKCDDEDSYERDVWRPNPDFDEEESDTYLYWLRIHKEIYRNGSCRRQRVHAARKWKRIHSRRHRRECDRIVRERVAEYWKGDAG